MNKNKKILVTGGCGFIGSNLIEFWLRKDPNVKIVLFDKLTYAANLNFLETIQRKNPQRVDFIKGDLCDKEALKIALKDCDVVYHLAAETHVGKSNLQGDLFVASNIIGTYTLLQATREVVPQAKLVVVSSAEIYGSLAQNEKLFTENISWPKPQSIYAATKCSVEHLAYCMNFLYNLDITVVRLFNNFGPRQHPEKVIPRFICRAINKIPLEIEGDGFATRDWIFVEETCLALYKLAFVKLDNFEVINIASQTEVSIGKIAEFILDYFSLNKEIYSKHVEERQGNVHRHFASNEKMCRLLDMQIKIGFFERLKELIEWYKRNIDHLSLDSYTRKIEQ